MHSRHSYDCLTRPRDIVDMALKRGLQGIAVTDHNTIAGGLECRALAAPDLLVIVGAEIYTDVGDIVGLFLHSEIRSRDPLEVIARIHEQRGIAFLPHPLRGHPPIPDAVLEACDAYEVLNGRAGWFQPINLTQTNWSCLETKARLGCSDAHFRSEIGVAHTLIGGPPTEENVLTRIRAGQVSVEGRRVPSHGFYLSQLVKMVKTRNPRMLLKLPKHIWRQIQ